MSRDSFVFYKSFFESIKELDNDTQLQVYNAICEYQFNDNEMNLTGIAKAIFTLIKPQLNANNSRYENGCKGGAPKGNQNAKKQPKNNLETTKKQPNDNVNVNDNVNEIEIIKENGKQTQLEWDGNEPKKEKSFCKPTVEEIKVYCSERNNGINAQYFYDFYESKGWCIGKNKMKDWRACIRTWEKNKQDNTMPKNDVKNAYKPTNTECIDFNKYYFN